MAKAAIDKELYRASVLPVFTKPRGVIAKTKLVIGATQVAAKVTVNEYVNNLGYKNGGMTLGLVFKYDKEWHSVSIQRMSAPDKKTRWPGLAIMGTHHTCQDGKAFDKLFRSQEPYFVGLAALLAMRLGVKM